MIQPDDDAANGDANEYVEMMRLAHQRTTLPLHPPSLTCHLGFRVASKDEDPVTQPVPDDFHKAQRLRGNSINKLLLHLYTRTSGCETRVFYQQYPEAGLRPARSFFALIRKWLGLPEEAASPTIEAPPQDPNARYVGPYDTLSVKLCTFDCFNIQLSILMQSEFTTLTFFATPRGIYGEDLSEFRAPCSDAYSALRSLMAAAELPSEFDPKVLYEAFWDGFFAETDLLGVVTGRGDPEHWLGERFAEFHGIALQTAEGLAYGSGMSKAERATFDRQVELANQINEKPPSQDLIRTYAPTQVTIAAELTSFVNKRSKYFARILGYAAEDVGQRFRPGNSIMCHMFDGLALYGSNLQPAAIAGAPAAGRKGVLRFFFVYGGPSRHQLGRLVRAVHRCGELRLAALFDYFALQGASNEIRQLDLAMSRDKQTPKEDARKSKDPTPQNLPQNWFKRISRMGRGGLDFRLSRSEYYSQMLRQRVKNLAVEDIAGWTNYESFIEQNLYRHFDIIRSIGDRYRALQLRLTRVENAETVRQLSKQQTAIAIIARNAEFWAPLAGALILAPMLVSLVVVNMGETPVVGVLCGLLHCERPTENFPQIIMLATFIVSLLLFFVIFVIREWLQPPSGKRFKLSDLITNMRADLVKFFR